MSDPVFEQGDADRGVLRKTSPSSKTKLNPTKTSNLIIDSSLTNALPTDNVLTERGGPIGTCHKDEFPGVTCYKWFYIIGDEGGWMEVPIPTPTIECVCGGSYPVVTPGQYDKLPEKPPRITIMNTVTSTETRKMTTIDFATYKPHVVGYGHEGYPERPASELRNSQMIDGREATNAPGRKGEDGKRDVVTGGPVATATPSFTTSVLRPEYVSPIPRIESKQSIKPRDMNSKIGRFIGMEMDSRYDYGAMVLLNVLLFVLIVGILGHRQHVGRRQPVEYEHKTDAIFGPESPTIIENKC